jgi:hypothetical protein
LALIRFCLGASRVCSAPFAASSWTPSVAGTKLDSGPIGEPYPKSAVRDDGQARTQDSDETVANAFRLVKTDVGQGCFVQKPPDSFLKISNNVRDDRFVKICALSGVG